MIRILITGDYCPRNRIDDLINLGKYQSVFEDIIPIVKGHDYSIVNLECPVVEHDDCAIKKQGPNLSSSLRAVEILKLLDFNLLPWLIIIFMIMETEVLSIHLNVAKIWI